jgi:hypothetical protein
VPSVAPVYTPFTNATSKTERRTACRSFDCNFPNGCPHTGEPGGPLFNREQIHWRCCGRPNISDPHPGFEALGKASVIELHVPEARLEMVRCCPFPKCARAVTQACWVPLCIICWCYRQFFGRAERNITLEVVSAPLPHPSLFLSLTHAHTHTHTSIITRPLPSAARADERQEQRARSV